MPSVDLVGRVASFGERVHALLRMNLLSRTRHGYLGKQCARSGPLAGPTGDSALESPSQIVVGINSSEGHMPTETLRWVKKEELFDEIDRAERQLRGSFRRLLSLKSVVAFAAYECQDDRHESRNVPVDITRKLPELYHDYRTRVKDINDIWRNWVDEKLNKDRDIPQVGGYALQLVLRWSVPKFVFWGSTPIVLSLAIGFWYMYSDHGDADPVAIIQTAWTISSYTVTTAALAIGLLAAITQLGGV